jgi:hypothetical protein
MQYLHVCCTGKSHREYEVRGLVYRRVDAEKLLAKFAHDTCGFVQVWRITMARNFTVGKMVHQPIPEDHVRATALAVENFGALESPKALAPGQDVSTSDLVDTYWQWDRRLSDLRLGRKG